MTPEKTIQFNAILACLNSAFIADQGAVHCLMAMRVPTNQAMLEHPDVIVRQEEVADYKSLSPLGIINGLLTAAGLPRVCLQFTESIDPKDDKKKVVRLTGIAPAPPEGQPADLERFALKEVDQPLPSPDQKLWEFLGMAGQKDIDAGGKYDRLVSEIEVYFGVGFGGGAPTKGDLAIKALQELVDTKNLKDSAGKTPEYEAKRLAAWEQAEKVLAIKTVKDTQ